MGSLLPFAAETAKVRYGPGTFPMLPFARDFAKLTNCTSRSLDEPGTNDNSGASITWYDSFIV